VLENINGNGEIMSKQSRKAASATKEALMKENEENVRNDINEKERK
jgi:hypothetical protein